MERKRHPGFTIPHFAALNAGYMPLRSMRLLPARALVAKAGQRERVAADRQNPPHELGLVRDDNVGGAIGAHLVAQVVERIFAGVTAAVTAADKNAARQRLRDDCNRAAALAELGERPAGGKQHGSAN